MVFFNEIVNFCNALFGKKSPPVIVVSYAAQQSSTRLIRIYDNSLREQDGKEERKNDSSRQSCHNSYFSGMCARGVIFSHNFTPHSRSSPSGRCEFLIIYNGGNLIYSFIRT